jgi:predicted nuclease of predicted toxin-antitoxin system
VKLLFDHNLSFKLVALLTPLYPDSTHVALLGLQAATDIVVWERAKQESYCLVSKDSDFNDLLASKGFPPKVVWIRLGNCTTAAIATLLEEHHSTLLEFFENPSAGLLELQQ